MQRIFRGLGGAVMSEGRAGGRAVTGEELLPGCGECFGKARLAVISVAHFLDMLTDPLNSCQTLSFM